MRTATPTHTIALGDLVAAIYDQAKGLTPTMASEVATRVVTEMLLRTDNRRALRALQARPTLGHAQVLRMPEATSSRVC